MSIFCIQSINLIWGLQRLQIFDNGQYSVHKKQEHKNGHQIFNEND